jgi:hypothetical protein
MASRAAKSKKPAPQVLIRFTGAAGGTLYTAEAGKVELRPGDTIQRPLTGHWAVLVASGDAEVLPA